MKYRLGILLFWLAMMGWLIRYEAFPERFSHRIDGYRGLFTDDVLLADEWMKILFNDKPIGYSQTRIDVDENDARRHYLVENHVHLRLKLLGETRDMHIRTQASLSDAHLLQDFAFQLSAPGNTVSVTATRGAGDLFNVETETGATHSRQAVRVPDDVVIYSPMTEMAMRRLAPGESLVLRTFDPASMSTAEMTVHAVRREKVAAGGEERDATVLSMDYLGMEILSWIDDAGNLLRQETPFGWTLVKCTPDEAFAAVEAASGAEDLLRGMAVHCRGTIRNPLDTQELRLRLTGAPLTPEELDTPRQSAVRAGDEAIDLTVRRSELTPAAPPPPVPAAELAPFLRPTKWIQSDHPDIVACAQKIVAGRTAPLDKALAILDWTYSSVAKEMTISLPSALDVLRTMSGDCNEHTYLFVALARAAGLPSKVVVGLAYHEGSFYYHAWPSVYVGHWVDMDPTWGEKTADATHVSLVEGEIESQLALGKVLGRLTVEVLASKSKGETAP